MVNDSDREAVDALPFGFGSSEELITKAFSAHRRAGMLEGARLMQEEAAEEAYANLDDPFLSGHGYATSTAQLIRDLDPETVIKGRE